MSDMIDYERQIPDILQAMAGVHDTMDARGLDRALHHLVLLRASQINRCGFCVKLHARDARKAGETDERLDRLVVWDRVAGFDDRERAALAWTEALTLLDGRSDFGRLRIRLREHFSEREIGLLTSTVAMINLWNRMQIARH